MHNTADNATTWRDLIDALTPKQVAYIEDWERHPEIPPRADGTAPTEAERAVAHLFTAREFVDQNAAAALYADIPAPADASTFLDSWRQWDDGYIRMFGGTRRQVDEHVTVDITGSQYCDGRTERQISVESSERFHDTEMTAAQARLVAAALLDAADELERLSTPERGL